MLELKRRRKDLTTFHRPIFFSTLIAIVGTYVFQECIDRGIFEADYSLWALIFNIPSIFVLVKDLRPTNPIRFSLAHCIFLVAVLYKLGFNATQIDSLLLNKIEDALEYYEIDWLVSYSVTICMIGHFIIFITVTSLGKISLRLVSTNNACAHLLFPFQFFDFVFLYTFFTIRSTQKDISGIWITQQLLLQINILGRNSGITDAITRNHIGRWTNKCLCRVDKFQGLPDPDDDPLFRLQFLARVSVQYDLADVTALLCVPSVVSFFVWRDGYFSLQDSGILVRSCDVARLWARFGILMIIKPTVSLLARNILKRAMRKTLLGKNTIHGRSYLAATLKFEGELGVGKEGGKQKTDMQDKFNYTEEQVHGRVQYLDTLLLCFPSSLAHHGCPTPHLLSSWPHPRLFTSPSPPHLYLSSSPPRSS